MKLASYIMEYMLLPPMARNGALMPLDSGCLNILLIIELWGINWSGHGRDNIDNIDEDMREIEVANVTRAGCEKPNVNQFELLRVLGQVNGSIGFIQTILF